MCELSQRTYSDFFSNHYMVNPQDTGNLSSGDMVVLDR